MDNSSIYFKGAFGNVNKDVCLSYVTGVGHPTYNISINNKLMGSISFVKLTTGGPPEKWICYFNDNVKDIFSIEDCQILIDIASKHYEENKNDLQRASYL